jgi:hypothetical protein
VLAGQEPYRFFLVSFLQKLRKKLITRSRLLYKWDKMNNINIHRYVDGHSNLVLLLKTDKNKHIAAYTQAAFKPNVLSNQLGVLISLDNQLTFRNAKKAIIYDEDELIFGNYELKVKAGDHKATSNFGAIGCFY